MQTLFTNHGPLFLPAFFPDATCGVVRSVDSEDVRQTGTKGLVVNTYHLFRHGLDKTVKEFGGIHRLMNWSDVLISDSGGFQVMSLIRDNPKAGVIRDKEIIFRVEGEKIILTPEKSIQVQLRLKTDIVMCLDDCTRPQEPFSEQEKSVRRTIDWAKRCKDEFVRLTKNVSSPPLIFAIIQGGNDKNLRRQCAEALLKMDFNGYAYGGWPFDEEKRLLTEIIQFTADLIPNRFPKYAMGVGKPENVVVCYKMGYNLFDCVIPTRDARHRRLYIFKNDPAKADFTGLFYDALYINDRDCARNPEPISEFCDCYTCKNYSRGYIHLLFKANDTLFFRLATIHNLRFYARMMEELGKAR